MNRLSGLLVLALVLLTFMQGSAMAGGYVGYNDPSSGGIRLSASVYVRASGAADEQDDPAQVVYSVIPYAQCDVTVREGAMCHFERDETCPAHPPDDAQNKWRRYQIYRSDDGGQTWNLRPTMTCLNSVVVEPDQAQVTGEMVRKQALQLLPSPVLSVQPPMGEALLGVPVIVATTTSDATPEPIALLGRQVRVRAHADAYSFDFGDGAVVSGTASGQPYGGAVGPCTPSDCDAYVHHIYTRPGTYTLALSVTWHAQFRVDGGAWQDVPGTIDTTSAGQPITIVEASAVLVNGQ